MSKHSIAAFAATSIITLSTSAALAHASLEQQEAAPGTYKAVLRVPHGCEGEATQAVRLEIPEGFVGVKPMPKPGWTLDIETKDYAKSYSLHGRELKSGAVAITWSGGNLPDGHYDEFVVRGTLMGVEEGQRLFFHTVQTCASSELAWIEEAAPGENAHALDHPAPFLTIAAASSAGEHAHHDQSDVSVGPLEISGAWARAMLPGQPTGGAYMTITNNGDEADTLVSITSPVAGKVEVHTMEMNGDVMVMRPLESGLEMPAGGSVELKPSGLHLMFMELKEPLTQGRAVPVTLEFEKAGPMELTLPVLPASTGRGANDHHQH